MSQVVGRRHFTVFQVIAIRSVVPFSAIEQGSWTLAQRREMACADQKFSQVASSDRSHVWRAFASISRKTPRAMRTKSTFAA